MALPLACLTGLLASGAAGQDTNSQRLAELKKLGLDQLLEVRVATVYGASKHEERVTDAPSSVSIVTSQDIQEYGYRTLGEILDGVRGFYLVDDWGYQFLGVRGVNRLGDYGGRILLNVNGHRLNEPIYGGQFLGYDFPLDVDLIEKVEVIRGPSSSLYGNNAFFGIVNVVTRPGRDIGRQGIEASVSAGEHESYTGRLQYSREFTNGVELVLSGTYFASAGNPTLEFPASAATGFPGAVQRGHDGLRATDLFASVAYRGFTLEGLYGRRDKELPNGPYAAVFNDDRNKVWDERAYLEARFEHTFENDWHVLTRAYFDHYAYAGSYVYDYQDPTYTTNLVVNRDTPLTEWWGGEIQLSRTLWGRHRFTLGIEGRHDVTQHQENYDVEPATIYTDVTTSPYTVGAYVQDEFEVLTNLTLSGGVRYDYFSTFGSTVNPRAVLIYHPWESSTIKAIYGQAFRAPNAFESDFEGAYYYVGNHDLKPETIRSYELVWEQGIARNYRVTGTLFYNQINDLITQVSDPGTDPADPADDFFIFRNTDSVDVKGAEAELEAHWRNGLRARISYTFADATDDTTGRRLNNSPQHVGKLQVTLPVYRGKVFAGVELLALSSRETAYGNRVHGHAVVNLTLFSRALIRNLDVSASVYNVLDQQYHDPAAPDFAQELQPRAGRTFRVKLTYRF